MIVLGCAINVAGRICRQRLCEIGELIQRSGNIRRFGCRDDRQFQWLIQRKIDRLVRNQNLSVKMRF